VFIEVLQNGMLPQQFSTAETVANEVQAVYQQAVVEGKLTPKKQLRRRPNKRALHYKPIIDPFSRRQRDSANCHAAAHSHWERRTQMANVTVADERLPDTIGTRRGLSLWQRMRRNFWGYVFIAPWVILYIVFGLYPLVLSFYLTFFDYSFVAPENRAFVGVGNWLQGILDPSFGKACSTLFTIRPSSLCSRMAWACSRPFSSFAPSGAGVSFARLLLTGPHLHDGAYDRR
jgi:hypothetical protein